MDSETLRQKLADLDEAGRIRALSRAIWILFEKHDKLARRIERNRKLTLKVAKTAIKGATLATAVAKAAFPRLFARKRKKLHLSKYWVGARLTILQQEVLAHLYEDAWSTAETARYMHKHRKVIYGHKKAAIEKLRRYAATRGIKASDIHLLRRK